MSQRNTDVPEQVLAEACPVHEVLDRVAGKWSILIIVSVARGPIRFTELERSIDRISRRMLTLTGAKADGWLPSMGYAEPEDLPRAMANRHGLHFLTIQAERADDRKQPQVGHAAPFGCVRLEDVRKGASYFAQGRGVDAADLGHLLRRVVAHVLAQLLEIVGMRLDVLPVVQPFLDDRV